jgi:protein-S-isoprenylcysteine O-methyltransferase Ste14
MSLNRKAWLSLVLLATAMSLLLFLPAGTVDYWQAWAYLGVFFGASILVTIYLIERDPALLERRLRGGPTAEKQTTQRIIMLWTSLGFVGLLVVPALDFRFQWSSVPTYVVVSSDALIAAGFTIIFFVYRENTFTSATIEVAKDQKVVSTGPYSVVRHPMYAGGLLYIAATSPALGSFYGLLVFLAMLPALLWRMFAEEAFLAENLPGYVEYCAKVRWRLIPKLF